MKISRTFVIVIATGLWLISARAVHSQTSPTQDFELPFGSVSFSDDLWSLHYNPAGLSLSKGLQAFYWHGYNDSVFEGNNALFTSLGKMAFAVEWLGNGTSATYQRYTTGQGLSFGKKLYLGASYSWFGSANKDLDKLASFSLGAMLRPSPYLSWGFKASDLNHPVYLGKRSETKFDYGLAIRPLTERITLGVEGESFENQSFFNDAQYRFKAELEVAPGLYLQGQVNQGGDRFFLGGRINLPNFGAGSYNFFGDKGGFRRGGTYVGVTSYRYPTILQRKNNFLVMALPTSLPEEARRGGVRTKAKTVRDILEVLEKAKQDPAISGLVIKIDGLDCGLGKIQELREALRDFKANHKNIIAFLEVAGTKEYYLATAADKIIILPSGYLDFTGLAAKVTFLKGTLGKLGIEADFEHIGKYKTASDLLTRDSMSESHQEVVNSVLDDLFGQLTSQIASDRGWTKEEVTAKVNQGPFTAKEALEAGLVDRLAYPDELENIIKDTPRKKLSLLGTKPKLLAEREYSGRKEFERSWGQLPQIAIVYVTGTITSGASGGDLLMGNTVGAYTVANSIRHARLDNAIKAIVLRVDSPGGSGIASEVIWRELKEARKKKPVIVSMSDVAASGGYFVSIPAEEIFSHPATLTGSIGVITGKFDFSGLYHKIGVNIQTEKRGERADMFSASQRFSDGERDIVRRQVREFYDDFVGKVAEGRSLDTTQVDSLAQGRVWTGNQALSRQLVDRLGGLKEALTLAKLKAGLKIDQKVEIVALPKYRSPFPFGLDRLVWFADDLSEFKDFWQGKFAFKEGEMLYMLPYQLEVK